MVRWSKLAFAIAFLASTALAATKVKFDASSAEARRAYEASDYTKAIQDLPEAAAEEPQTADIQWPLARSHLELQELDPASRSAEKAGASDPQNSEYHEP